MRRLLSFWLVSGAVASVSVFLTQGDGLTKLVDALFPPTRLDHQRHNRMVYIHTEGNPEVHVDMRGHYDLGSPCISPDGTLVAFDALTIGHSPVRETWLVATDGTGRRKVANGAAPRWSRDGKRLLLTGQLGQEPAIVEIELASGAQRQLMPGHFADWSPDGKRIAFGRDGSRTGLGGTHDGSHVFVANADGSEPVDLGLGDRPSWSPDGKTIACCIDDNREVPAIWLIDVQTQKRSRLGAGFYQAQWAGNGRTIVVNGLVAAGQEPDGRYRFEKRPARFALDTPDRPEFFLTDLDNPWSPDVSRDGKTVVLIVDSELERPYARTAQ